PNRPQPGTGRALQMILQALAFYLFSAILIASAFMVIPGRNPVHSVLFLILAFFNAAGLFVLLGAEFLAMILVVVYVGAVAVLFLFVVMMVGVPFVRPAALAPTAAPIPTAGSGVTNTEALGRVLYTQYAYYFEGAGLILL